MIIIFESIPINSVHISNIDECRTIKFKTGLLRKQCFTTTMKGGNSLGHTASQEQQGKSWEKNTYKDDEKIIIQLESIR